MSSSSCSYSPPPLTFFTTTTTTTTATTRVSISLSQSLLSSSTSSSSSQSPSLRLSAVTRGGFAPVVSLRRCSFSFSPHVSCVASSFSSPTRTKVKAMAEMVNKEEEECSHSRTFVDARTEQDLLLGIRKEAEAGRLPSNVATGLEELYQSYKTAVFESGQPGAEEIVLTNMATVFDRILAAVEDSFVFLPHHKAIRAPFDYYMFGQNYIRPLVDFRNSYVGNISLFKEIELQLQQGHNVVLMSNHQSEADPAIIALLLETTNQNISENLTYIAGDRVITDPLSKPFSMGRNLICVYSKKHMHDEPELVEVKRKANTRSLKEMALLLRSGSQLIWIAPSGGRDRPDPHTGEWFPAPFDSSAVDNMRRLVQHSGAPGHIYPLSILCHDIMPPPAQVEKEIGEKRVMLYSGTGLSVEPEINFADISAGCETPEEAKDAYSQAMYNSVSEQYNVLKTATIGKQGLEASIPSVSLSQPWNH